MGWQVLSNTAAAYSAEEKARCYVAYLYTQGEHRGMVPVGNPAINQRKGALPGPSKHIRKGAISPMGSDRE